MFPLNKKQKAGFTLIELLVVISIISLLTSIVLSSLGIAKSKGRDAARIRAMHETRTALQMYFNDKGYYPCNYNATQFCTKKMSVELKENGYISEIHPDIVYSPYAGYFSLGCGDGIWVSVGVCTNYQMGVLLENWNSVLNSDSDQDFGSSVIGTVDGVSTKIKCARDTTANTTTDRCYDFHSKQ